MISLLVLIGVNITKHTNVQHIAHNKIDPTYKSENSDTAVYSPEGFINYRLISKGMKCFSKQGILYLTKPTLIVYNRDQISIWLVQSDRAKMTSDQMLYLHGHVEVKSTTSDSQIRKINTEHAQINLITRDITSQSTVTLYGQTFHSIGLRFRGNLNEKHADLLEKVRTSYEIKNKKIRS